MSGSDQTLIDLLVVETYHGQLPGRHLENQSWSYAVVLWRDSGIKSFSGLLGAGIAASLSAGGSGPVPVYHNGKLRINVLQNALARRYSADELRPFRQSTAGPGDPQEDP